MGPLIPYIISDEFNFIIALIVGIGFGVALEQAGFASTKKLVGLFYGYDFTVLRVFFTAGVTAMTGIIILDHFNLLDLSLIYINPTFLWSAIVGGLVMGLGFIIGGFCPGTSACAAATGRVDGWAFLFGSVIGIFIFTETFSLTENLYYAENWGPVTMFEQLNMSREAWAICMLIIAAIAFIATQIIENKVNKVQTKWYKPTILKNAIIIATPILIVLVLMIAPTRRELMDKRISAKIEAGECNPKMMNADKLAYELMHQYYKFNVIDIRNKEAYNQFHIPTAINIPLEELDQNLSIIIQNLKTNVFYADNLEQAKRACMVSKYYGKSDNFALDITANEFNAMFFNLKKPNSGVSKSESELFYFRESAGIKLKEVEESVANLDKPVEKKQQRVKGGCS